MLKRPIGKSGIEGSVVALGTWAIGGWLWGGTEEKKSIEAIQTSIDRGINLIDTAPAYGMGYSEEIVGKAIAGRRDEVVIATKCAMVWHTDKGEPHIEQNGKMINRYLNPDSIRYEVEQSLKRLNVETIDVYQTHWQDDGVTPIEDTMACLMDLKQQGKIRAIGASNVNVQHMKEYMAAGQLDNIQNKYSMMDRNDENDVLPVCQENQIAYFAYSPMSMGLLTGKVTPDRHFPDDDVRSRIPRFSKENIQAVQPFLDDLNTIAVARECTMAQLTIAWTAEKVSHVLVGARNQEQAISNADAGEVKLTPEEVQQIDNLIAKYQTKFA
jgi:aryl-alcohol dehydrogenase-like predicted oxidoreductase